MDLNTQHLPDLARKASGGTAGTQVLRDILERGVQVDDESTLVAAWIYQQLTNNASLVALLGTNGLSVPNIFRYFADETAVEPYIVFNLTGGPGDSLTSDHRRVLTELQWYITLVTKGGDDLIIGPILRYIVLSLHKQGGDFLSGRIIDGWRDNVLNSPPEVSKDETFIYSVSVFTFQATMDI